MGRGATGLLRLSACLGLPAGLRAADPTRPLLLPPAPVKSTTAIRPVSHDDSDLPPQSGPLAPRADSTAPPAERADHPPDPPPPRKPAAGLARPDGSRTVPAHLVETAADRRPADD